MGDYPIFGIQLFQVYLKELVSHRKTQWCDIGHEVVGTTTNGQEKKISKVMYNDTTPIDLIKDLKPRLLNFVLHNFVACWQEKEFKGFLKHILEDTIASCIDFSNNYAMKVQNEIQDMHWFSFQSIVLVHITYWYNLEYDPTIDGFKILKEVHYHISNEKKHGTLFY